MKAGPCTSILKTLRQRSSQTDRVRSAYDCPTTS